jgi:hypothetical protein
MHHHLLPGGRGVHHPLRRRTAGARLNRPTRPGGVDSLTGHAPGSQRIREQLKHFVALGHRRRRETHADVRSDRPDPWSAVRA